MVHLLLVIIYLAFISLGLPDALLGAAWPTMQGQLGVDYAYAGYLSIISSAGTILSSIFSDRLTRRFGVGKVTAFSVLMTAIALIGFARSNHYLHLALWAIPYGMGAGSVDVGLNNYVAVHYKSHHMSWLHFMWGIGASIGPWLMGLVLTNQLGWPMGYWWVAFIQFGLTGLLFVTLPLWHKVDALKGGDSAAPIESGPLTFKKVASLAQVKDVWLTFFAYSAFEVTAALWASSYFVLAKGLTDSQAASFAGLFYLGITLGRGVAGFMTFRYSDKSMIRLGLTIIALGIISLALPIAGANHAILGFVLMGLGCAPIYPSVLHMIPGHFGRDKSQAIIGYQMAFSYSGSLLMPSLFGWLMGRLSVQLLPYYLALFLILMVFNLGRFLSASSQGYYR
ncbi:TPA: sugar MFS transporter [Streptococcus suis]